MAPTVVAEVSANHLGSLDRALKLVDAISKTGASHVKFQTYTADTMTIDHNGPGFTIAGEHELWGGRNLYTLYHEAHTPWDWHPQLFAKCRKLGLIPFSSPFDFSAVDFLEDLDAPMYKVASMEIGDLPLIRRIAATQRPIVMSTGAASLEELDEAVMTAQSAGCADLTLLLCTSSYPARPQDAHLARMEFLRSRYALPIGLSDHTLGIGVSVAATALGAVMIERHVTMNRADGGPDAAFSLEPDELARLVSETSVAAKAIGSASWASIAAEETSRALKRSLYICENCEAGEILTTANLRSIRPSGGLEPKYYEQLLGRRLVVNVERGTPLSWDLIEGGQN